MRDDESPGQPRIGARAMRAKPSAQQQVGDLDKIQITFSRLSCEAVSDAAHTLKELPYGVSFDFD